MSERASPDPTPNAIRAFTENDLTPEYRAERDKVRQKVDGVIDWCIEHEDELPTHVSLVRPKEGVVQVNLKADELAEDESDAEFLIIQRDDVALLYAEQGVNPDMGVAMIRGYMSGANNDTYASRKLLFMTNGLVKLQTSEEAEVEIGGITTYRPVQPYTSTPAHIEDLRFEETKLQTIGQAVGLPGELL